MLIKKAAREKKLKQQQQQQSVPKPKIDTHNKWASKHVIRKPIEKKKVHEANGRNEKPIAVKKADVEASDSERPKIPAPQRGAKRWDRVQKEAAERRRVVEELKKTEDERRELRQKLLEEANKRKALKAQITAREIEEKRLLEAKRERNRLEIKLKEEKLRKLKLYEAEQIRLHMEEEKKWGKSANNRMTRKKKILLIEV